MNWMTKYLPANPTTITGRMLGIAILTSMLAVIDGSLTPLLSLLIWVLLIAFICGLLFQPKLVFYMQESPLLINGQDADIEIIVENRGRYAAYDLQLSFPYSHQGLLIVNNPKVIGELAAQEHVILTFQVKPSLRGEYQLPRIQVASLFPFGMFKFVSKQSIETRVLVAPRYEIETHHASMSQSSNSNLAGWSSERHRALEYVGSREYREGLAVRRWDFAAWARLGIPTVREFSEAHEATVMIVVDTLKSRARIDHDLEELLSKAATVAIALDGNGLRVVLFIVSESVEVIDGYGNRDQADTILRALARIAGAQVQPDWAETWNRIRDLLMRDSELICFLRSDHSSNEPSPSEELQTFGATIDWTPVHENRHTSKAARRSPARPQVEAEASSEKQR